MILRRTSQLLALALRPLRHLLPAAWRIEIKTWIRDRSRSRPVLNRLLTWFTGSQPPSAFLPEEALPPPRPEDWRDNSPHPSPLLTVVIPFHNHGEYLPEALASLRRQTFQDFEVIIVDDGSDDPASLQVLRELEGTAIQIIRQENRGLPAARNAGLRLACGRYLCCLDADDALRPTHFEKLLLALESRQCDLAHCDLERFDQGEGQWRGAGFHAEALLRGNAVGNAATAVVRLDAWKRVGGFNESLAGYQDWNFWLDLAEAGCQAAHVPEPLFLYRRHGTSMISRSARRHGELTSQIRELHRDLYENPERVQEIESARRRLVSRDPFLNMTPERHLPPRDGIRRCLLLAESFGRGGSLERALKHVEVLDPACVWKFLAVTPGKRPGEAEGDLTARLEGAGVPCYHAGSLVPPEYVLDLIIHLHRVHRPDLTVAHDTAKHLVEDVEKRLVKAGLCQGIVRNVADEPAPTPDTTESFIRSLSEAARTDKPDDVSVP